MSDKLNITLVKLQPHALPCRLHNKSVYVKMGLKKMVSRKSWRDLHKEIRLEVDGKQINLPPVEGIIILNILRYICTVLNLTIQAN